MMGVKKILRSLLKIKTPEESAKDYLLKNGMKVGNNTTIYSWLTIDSGKPWLIEIGDNVIISTEVRILTHDASTLFVDCGTKLGRVTIGNHSFIGARSTILCNVTIGDNVIIGAGSVVTKDLPSGAVYAGVPAQFVCSIEEYKYKMQKLQEERPSFNDIRPWDTWKDATIEEKRFMYDSLSDGVGFF